MVLVTLFIWPGALFRRQDCATWVTIIIQKPQDGTINKILLPYRKHTSPGHVIDTIICYHEVVIHKRWGE
jgi:hypothetical protein